MVRCMDRLFGLAQDDMIQVMLSTSFCRLALDVFARGETRWRDPLIMAAKDAQQCGPMAETEDFLDLVRFQTSDGEFGKFYSAQIENLCTNRPLCFLEALAKLDLTAQKDVIKRLISPQFVGRPSIEAAFTMNGKNPKYRKLVEMYQK